MTNNEMMGERKKCCLSIPNRALSCVKGPRRKLRAESTVWFFQVFKKFFEMG